MADELEPVAEPCATCGEVGCESAHAPVFATLVCRTKDCERQNRGTEVHVDTVLPILCGGCGHPLHCEHAWEPVTRREGTLGAPVDVTGQRCAVCKTEDVARTPSAPVDLASLPIGILEQLGA